MSKQFRMELYGRKSCIAFMDKEPLIVDAALDIDALTFRTVEYGEKALSDGFIITRDGAFAGTGNGLQLMRVVADMQASRNRQIMHSIEYASVIQQSTLRSSWMRSPEPVPQLIWSGSRAISSVAISTSSVPMPMAGSRPWPIARDMACRVLS
jgi:hypothetical protein